MAEWWKSQRDKTPFSPEAICSWTEVGGAMSSNKKFLQSALAGARVVECAENYSWASVRLSNVIEIESSTWHKGGTAQFLASASLTYMAALIEALCDCAPCSLRRGAMSAKQDWNEHLTALNELLAELYPTIAASRRIVGLAGLPPSYDLMTQL
jgi:hypothetical protein